MPVLGLRLFWESRCILFFCVPHSPYLPSHFNAFARFLTPEDPEQGGCWHLVLVGGAGSAPTRAAQVPLRLREIWRAPGPAPAAGRWPQHRCPRPPGSQRQGEKNKAIAFVRFLKQIRVLCHLFCNYTKPSELFGRRQKICSEAGEKMDVKIRR